MIADWEHPLWTWLEELTEEDRIVAAGGAIVHITRELLPALGAYRREMVLEVLARSDWDATKLAEVIGSRRTTVVRLAEEGRAARRRSEVRDGSGD